MGTLGDLTALGCADAPLTVAACMLWTLPMYCDDDAAAGADAAAAVRSPKQHQTDAAETSQAMRRSALQPLLEALDALQAGSKSPGRLASFMGGLTAVRASRVADAARLALLFCRDSLATLAVVLRRGPAHPSNAMRTARQLHVALVHVLQVRVMCARGTGVRGRRYEGEVCLVACRRRAGARLVVADERYQQRKIHREDIHTLLC